VRRLLAWLWPALFGPEPEMPPEPEPEEPRIVLPPEPMYREPGGEWKPLDDWRPRTPR
jgi:hypothetical protein